MNEIIGSLRYYSLKCLDYPRVMINNTKHRTTNSNSPNTNNNNVTYLYITNLKEQ